MSYQRQEGFFQSDDHKLFFQAWIQADSQANILIVHGHGEHSDSYHRVVEAMSGEPFSFYAMDLRGHGRSEGKRGYAAKFTNYVMDYKNFLQHIFQKLNPPGKNILLSHSMGGLIQLKALLDSKNIPVVAQALSAPLVGLALPVPAYKSKAASLLNNFLPKLTLWNEISNEMLSRDPDVIREFEKDPLRHSQMSAGVLLGFVAAMAEVQEYAKSITLPTFLQVAEADPVVSTEACRALFASLGSERKEIKIYGDGARHEIFNDIHRDKVFADLKTFLKSCL